MWCTITMTWCMKEHSYNPSVGVVEMELYAAGQETTVREFISSELQPHCEKQQVIHNEMGSGPTEITS